GEALGEIERARPADIVLEVAVHLLVERGVVLGLRIGLFEAEDQRHQRLGDEAATIDAEMSPLVGPGAERIGLRDAHARLAIVLGSSLRATATAALRAAWMKLRILSRSLTPGARSTPDETSTPPVRVMRNASPTLAASSPPDSMCGTWILRFSS